METPPRNKYKCIKVTGTPTVELVEPMEYHKRNFKKCCTFLILGRTGAGKSTFIEALASNTSLAISSNRLDGFTQSISVYQLNNLRTPWWARRLPMYVVDVPGFSDTKISEMKILSMLKDWIKKTGRSQFIWILYFIPINSTRLPRSQREVLQTFQALTGSLSAPSITVVSTMWDCVGSETAKQRADRNFAQLRNDEYIDLGTEILKFRNTQESALSILDQAMLFRSLEPFNFETLLDSGVPLRQMTFAGNIYEGLQTRLWNIRMDLANIQSELQGAAERDDTQLTEILIPRLEEAQKLLATLEQELWEFGDPPVCSVSHSRIYRASLVHMKWLVFLGRFLRIGH